jgi:hypothetical protein
MISLLRLPIRNIINPHKYRLFSAVASENISSATSIVHSSEGGNSLPKTIPRHRHDPKKIEKIPINIYSAVQKVKDSDWAKFDSTVEISICTTLDPRKPNQSIKGVAKLPHGSGKKIRVAVFATGQLAAIAKEAGADVVGGEDLIERIKTGDIGFERAIATPEMMPLLGKIGKVRIMF